MIFIASIWILGYNFTIECKGGKCMKKRVFISYCHQQKDWVQDRLVPCLRAGGAEVLIDIEQFKAGCTVIGQMDAVQDSADISVLVLSPEYLASNPCVHEMNRAVNRDPSFTLGVAIPVMIKDCVLPSIIKVPDPVYVDMRDDKNEVAWGKLMKACEADLGTSAPHWLEVRDEVCRFLGRNQSVNLLVSGTPKWKELIDHIGKDYIKDLGIVELRHPSVINRRGLIEQILRSCGINAIVTNGGRDLQALDEMLTDRHVYKVALVHFDVVEERRRSYNVDLFITLRYLMMEKRNLVLLVHSCKPFSTLLPKSPNLSFIDIKTVQLKGESQP
jgi:hypothetical protein